MSTQSNYEGNSFLGNAEMIGWGGSGLASGAWGPKAIAKRGMYKSNVGKMGKYFSGRELLQTPNNFYNIAFDKYGGNEFLFGTSRRSISGGKIVRTGSKGMIKKQAALYARRQMRGALRIAGQKGTGIATTAGWRAASRKGLTGAFAKVAAGKIGSVGLKLFNAGFAAQLVYGATKASFLMLRSEGRRAGKLNMGKAFTDTEAAYTERQRSLRAITSSRMSTRSAIGGEAAMMHR